MYEIILYSWKVDLNEIHVNHVNVWPCHEDMFHIIRHSEWMCLEPRPMFLPLVADSSSRCPVLWSFLLSIDPSLPRKAIDLPWAFEDVWCYEKMCFRSWMGFICPKGISQTKMLMFETKSNWVKGTSMMALFVVSTSTSHNPCLFLKVKLCLPNFFI